MPYQCNCGKIFDSPMERIAHIASCPIMTESKEYRALEILANLLYEELEPYRPTHARNWSREIIDKLLQQTYPCENPNCVKGHQTIHGEHASSIGICPDCQGTGRGRKVLFTQEDILKGFNIPDGVGGYYCLGHVRKPVERPQLIIEE